MRISFVVTVFNKASYLPHVWAGLAAQERAPGTEHEFVFVDDGSSDSSVEVLRRLAGGRPDVVILQHPNAGPAVTLNRGLAAATGDLVKLLDSDDVLLPWCTRTLAEAIAATGAEAAYAPFEHQGLYDPDGAPGEAWAGPPPAMPAPRRVDLLPISLRRPQATPSLWLARREALLAAGGSDTGVFVQDYSLELRLAARGPVAAVDGRMVLYPQAAPGRLSDAQAQVLHDVNAALLRFLRANPGLDPALRATALRRAAGRAWLWASRHGSWAEAGRSLALHGLATLGALPPAWAAEEVLCRAFREGQRLRLPGSPAPATAPAPGG